MHLETFWNKGKEFQQTLDNMQLLNNFPRELMSSLILIRSQFRDKISTNEHRISQFSNFLKGSKEFI